MTHGEAIAEATNYEYAMLRLKSAMNMQCYNNEQREKNLTICAACHELELDLQATNLTNSIKFSLIAVKN